MKDTDGNDITKGDKVLVYRPGVTETATVDLPDPRQGMTNVFLLQWPDGFYQAYSCGEDGKPHLPSDWRVVKV